MALNRIEQERAKARARVPGLDAGPTLHKPKARLSPSPTRDRNRKPDPDPRPTRARPEPDPSPSIQSPFQL